MTITSDQIILLASILGAFSVIYGIVKKPFDSIHNVEKSIEKLTEQVKDIQDDLAVNADMVYQLLNHAATNNNTGGMQEALNRYVQYFIK